MLLEASTPEQVDRVDGGPIVAHAERGDPVAQDQLVLQVKAGLRRTHAIVRIHHRRAGHQHAMDRCV